ncbi:MAG: 2-phosphosulfolactate phosphatase [Candidatus Altiarchaeota archaeon]
MDVLIKSLLEGARQAQGVAVVLDVFRASSTLVTLFERGMEEVYPVETIEEARILKEQNPDLLLMGERGGFPPEGFDLGNSPAEVSNRNFSGRRCVFSTSSGTKAISVAFESADEVWVGCFLNAGAVIKKLKQQSPKIVSLVASGMEGMVKSTEDENCALYIKRILKEEKVDFKSKKKEIGESRFADRLRARGQQEDLDFSLQLNKYHLVPKVYSDLKFGKVIKV